MTRLRMAVIGTGHLGRVHARVLASLDSVELVGVVDPNAAACDMVAADLKTRSLRHYRPLLGEIDAAVIATPTQLHRDVATELLSQGVHVLVEKPLASTAAQADELVELAARFGCVLQVGHVERFNPALTAALPYLGEPKYIEAVRAGVFAFRSLDIGVVMDLMIHDIDLVLSLVRSPAVRVEALGISVFGDREDVANARLTFENGCVATLSASRASYAALRKMHVWSPRAFVSLDLGARQASLVRPSETLLRRQFDAASLPPEAVGEVKERLFEDLLPLETLQVEPCDQITAELMDFIDSVQHAREPRVSGAQGRDAIVVAEAVLAAIETHAWDGTADGRHGPFATPLPRVIPAPHWNLAPQRDAARKEAG